MKVTLKTIADESGCSISTVSRVLNGTGNISAEVQKRIVKVAERLNYPFAKSKIPFYSNASLNIALIMDFKSNEFYASYFFGFSEASAAMGIRLVLIPVNNGEEALIKAINDLDPQKYDGICLYMPELTNEFYVKMKRKVNNNIPIISNTITQNPLIPTVTFDGYSGGYIAAEHLMHKGYTTFGIVKGPFKKIEARFRYNGFKDALEFNEHSIMWETSGTYLFESGQEAYEEYKTLHNKPSAVFISNDLMANGFLEAAKNDGMKIPAQVAIVSHDDLPLSKRSYPPISSIHTDFTELGKTTFQIIKERILKNSENRNTLSLIPVSLCERGTT